MALEDIKVTLPKLLDSLTPGDEVILTPNHQPVAKLVSGTPRPREPRKAGNCIGMIRIVADDNEHLEDFEYMISVDPENRAKVNHGRFGDLLAPVQAVAGLTEE